MTVASGRPYAYNAVGEKRRQLGHMIGKFFVVRIITAIMIIQYIMIIMPDHVDIMVSATIAGMYQYTTNIAQIYSN